MVAILVFGGYRRFRLIYGPTGCVSLCIRIVKAVHKLRMCADGDRITLNGKQKLARETVNALGSLRNVPGNNLTEYTYQFQ